MSKVLGINAVFHDPAAALVVDGEIVAATEEERLSRRKHGKLPVPFSTWELPEQAMAWCLSHAGVEPRELDAVVYSYDPGLCPPYDDLLANDWEGLRTLYAQRAPLFCKAALPGFDPERMRYVAHHVAHAASAALAAPLPASSVLVLDGRGETRSHLAGRWDGHDLQVLAAQELPHSLGILYEEVTQHLGFRRSSDEYKVMAMASYGEPRHIEAFRELVYTTGDGGFRVEPVDWQRFAPRAAKGGDDWTQEHADLAATVQKRLEEVLLELCGWLHDQTGDRALTLAGGTALNCVANTRIFREWAFEQVWVQPAAGDSGTALGGALWVAHQLGDATLPMTGADLGRGWSDAEIEAWLQTACVPYERPRDVADTVAETLAANGIVAWFQGRSEYGPRALGHRSLLAHPGHPQNLERMNNVKGREQFRPVAPMVLAERATEVFDGGPLPSPYMLFVHRVRSEWLDRIPAVVHVDKTARIQTVDAAASPLMHRAIACFERRTGLPVVVNTSLNTAGRPMVDDPRDALECFGSAPVDLLAIGPFVVRRSVTTPRTTS